MKKRKKKFMKSEKTSKKYTSWFGIRVISTKHVIIEMKKYKYKFIYFLLNLKFSQHTHNTHTHQYKIENNELLYSSFCEMI